MDVVRLLRNAEATKSQYLPKLSTLEDRLLCIHTGGVMMLLNCNKDNNYCSNSSTSRFYLPDDMSSILDK